MSSRYNTGYFSNEEATASTLDSEGWLRTGDLCYIDEDGFIFVVDRLKELIKYKGYQVNKRLSLSFFQYIAGFSIWPNGLNTYYASDISLMVTTL